MKPDVVLARAPELVLEFEPNGAVVAVVDGRTVPCGEQGLAVLTALDAPRRARDVVEELAARAKTPTDFMMITAAVQLLLKEGVLRDAGTPDAPLTGATTAGYQHADIHVQMLDDTTRTDAFLAAIRAVVRPHDVVVDIGTGSGVLAIAAAKAGASRVYAIEATSIADSAEAVARANGVADVVRVVRGWSTRTALPERADVLVTEMIGHEPFSEDALLITWDARKRLLKEGARMVPRSLVMYAYPARMSDEERARRAFTPEAIATWRHRYEIDFSPLLSLPPPPYISPRSTDVGLWEALAEPVALGTVDFATSEVTVDLCGRGAIGRDGLADAIVLYFDLELAPGVTMTTAPRAADASNHWRTPVWLPRAPIAVKSGQSFEVRYRFAKSRGDVELAIH